MLIQLDLNQNDLEALLRHCQTHKPGTGDAREDQRLADALEALEEALEVANTARSSPTADTGINISVSRGKPIPAADGLAN